MGSPVVNLTALAEARSLASFGSMSSFGRTLKDEDGVGVGLLEDQRDASCLVATHNAADVLIEVARTAKTLEAAEAQWREVGSEAFGALGVLDSARRQHREALAKVSL